MFTTADAAWSVAGMVLVAVIAARVPIGTFLLSLIVAACSLLLFNLESPFQASLTSPFAFLAWLSWFVFIVVVRLFVSPRKQQP